jgi:hypothetical protein
VLPALLGIRKAACSARQVMSFSLRFGQMSSSSGAGLVPVLSLIGVIPRNDFIVDAKPGGPKVRRGRFSKIRVFQWFLGAGSGAGLYRNLERFYAIRCEA